MRRQLVDKDLAFERCNRVEREPSGNGGSGASQRLKRGVSHREVEEPRSGTLYEIF